MPRGASHRSVIPSGPQAGWILVAGGPGDDYETLASTGLYDPITNRFMAGPKMHSPRTWHSAIAVASGFNAGKILIAGAEDIRCDKQDKCNYRDFEIAEFYNPATNAFEPGAEMHGAIASGAIAPLPPAPPPM